MGFPTAARGSDNGTILFVQRIHLRLRHATLWGDVSTDALRH